MELKNNNLNPRLLPGRPFSCSQHALLHLDGPWPAQCVLSYRHEFTPSATHPLRGEMVIRLCLIVFISARAFG